MAHSAIFRIRAVAAGDIAAAEQGSRGWDIALKQASVVWAIALIAFGALIAAGASVAAAKAPVAAVSRVSRMALELTD